MKGEISNLIKNRGSSFLNKLFSYFCLLKMIWNIWMGIAFLHFILVGTNYFVKYFFKK